MKPTWNIKIWGGSDFKKTKKTIPPPHHFPDIYFFLMGSRFWVGLTKDFTIPLEFCKKSSFHLPGFMWKIAGIFLGGGRWSKWSTVKGRNPKQPPSGFLKNPVHNGIQTIPIYQLVSRISSINSITSVPWTTWSIEKHTVLITLHYTVWFIGTECFL